jgi:flagellar basal-body rod protein FlgC
MPIDPVRRPSLLPIPNQGSIVRPMFKTLGIAGSGLAAQRQRMEMIAQNVANADVTRGGDGQPYKRRDVVLEAANSQNAVYGDNGAGSGVAAGTGVFGNTPYNVPSASSDSAKSIEVMVLPHGAPAGGPNGGPLGGEFGVRVSGVAEDQGEGRLVYEPNHPDANADGFVRYPDIDTTQELVKLMDAKRIYEANVSVFQTAKSILRASLDI